MSALNETIEKMERTCKNLGETWETFEADMKRWQKDQEKKGVASADLSEKIEKMSGALVELDGTKQQLDAQIKDIDAQKKRLDELEEQLNTPLITKNGDTIVPKKVKAAHNRFLRNGDLDALREVNDYVEKSMNLTVAEQGGLFYTITEDTSIEPLIREICPMRQVCDVKTISTTAYQYNRKTGNTNGGWQGELEAPTDTNTPTYAMSEIEAHTIFAQPAISQKMLEDASFNVEAELNEDLAETFGEIENLAYMSGNGVKKPRGMLTYTYSATPTATQVLYIASGASGDWAASDPHLKLLGVSALLKSQFTGAARWMMRRAQLAEICRWVDGDKRPLWQPSMQLGVPSSLLGIPITLNEQLPVKAANSLSVLYGDFKRAYTIVDRRGTVVLRDPFTSKPLVKFYTTKRTGGDLRRFDAHLAVKFAGS